MCYDQQAQIKKENKFQDLRKEQQLMKCFDRKKIKNCQEKEKEENGKRTPAFLGITDF